MHYTSPLNKNYNHSLPLHTDYPLYKKFHTLVLENKHFGLHYFQYILSAFVVHAVPQATTV
jgi:hypothetical protein